MREHRQRTLRLLCVTLEPDGTATGCNPVQVGSTPTGVFLFPWRANLA
jgi:hypothetical protein